MSNLAALRGGFAGELITPDAPSYEEARKIWNGAIDKRPGLIARCTRVADVISAVRWARGHDVEVAVRSGGHGVAGTALSDGGVVIDLRQMNGIRVDPERETVTVDAGVLLGDLCRQTQRYGLAVPSGIISHTGVAGLTLGGGIGWLMRKLGLACDSLLSAQLVTANGEVMRASDEENPELMWGLRGGGGNFGIVTSFQFRCHPVGPTVLAGAVIYAAEDAPKVLPLYREFAVSSAPPELTTILFIRHAPPAPWVPDELRGRPVLVIGCCFAGAIGEGERVVAPLRRWAEPVLDLLRPMDLTEFHYMFDASVPHGLGYYWKSLYLPNLTTEAIDAFMGHGWEMASRRSYTIVFHMGGAIRDVAPEGTAFEEAPSSHPTSTQCGRNRSCPTPISSGHGTCSGLFSLRRPARPTSTS